VTPALERARRSTARGRPVARSRGARQSGGLLAAIKARLSPMIRHNVIAQSASYSEAAPSVSVLCVIDGEHERQSLGLLETVITSSHEDVEVVALHAGASVRGRSRTARLFAEHASIPMLLLRGDRRDLGGARNHLARHARGALLLALPARGGVFPSTIERLTRAVEDDPDASFAYAMVAVLDKGTAVELRGALPWEPPRLARENWIDTPVLIRRERLLELGGYAIDERLSGLEDFDLWCRIANSAGRGVHVPQVLAWHSPCDSAKPADVATLDPESARLLQERSPRLLAGPGEAS